MVNEQSLKNGVPLEIERKFLIQYPNVYDIIFCKDITNIRVIHIEQDYLSPDGDAVRRIRKSTENDVVKYWLTTKTRISSLIRIEDEKEITKEQYETYYAEIAGENTIAKTRYMLTFVDCPLIFELDLYSEWTDRAIIEVELPDETTNVKIPDIFHVIREVTDDEKYKNEYLSFHGFEKTFF